jgi:hypothetical protein
LTDRIERYRRVAAQAPEYRKALDAMREKDGRRFFLKNSRPNLAGAELQEQVRAAIESNGGRITTSQNQGPKDDGRFRQITVTVQFFASTPALQKILYGLEAQPPYPVGRKHDAATAECFPRLQTGTRSGARSECTTRRCRVRIRRPGQEVRAMNYLSARIHTTLWWLLPLAALFVIIGLETRWGRALDRRPELAEPIAPKPVVASLLPEYAIVGGAAGPQRDGAAHALQSDPPSGAAGAGGRGGYAAARASSR